MGKPHCSLHFRNLGIVGHLSVICPLADPGQVDEPRADRELTAPSGPENSILDLEPRMFGHLSVDQDLKLWKNAAF